MTANRLRLLWIPLIVLSLGLAMCTISFRAGLGATPYSTTDSMGKPMGFNDDFNFEHYRIILSNCSLSRTIREMGTYEWLLIGFHFVAIGLLCGEAKLKWTLRFLLLQPLIFPVGFLGFISVPGYCLHFFQERNDRESFVDMPFIWVVTHFFWICLSVLMAWTIYRWRSVITTGTEVLELERSLEWSESSDDFGRRAKL